MVAVAVQQAHGLSRFPPLAWSLVLLAGLVEDGVLVSPTDQTRRRKSGVVVVARLKAYLRHQSIDSF